MRCLHCNQRLGVFRVLRNEPFCSEDHREKYNEEQSRKYAERLMQDAQPRSAARRSPIREAAEAHEAESLHSDPVFPFPPSPGLPTSHQTPVHETPPAPALRSLEPVAPAPRLVARARASVLPQGFPELMDSAAPSLNVEVAPRHQEPDLRWPDHQASLQETVGEPEPPAAQPEATEPAMAAPVHQELDHSAPAGPQAAHPVDLPPVPVTPEMALPLPLLEAVPEMPPAAPAEPVAPEPVEDPCSPLSGFLVGERFEPESLFQAVPPTADSRPAPFMRSAIAPRPHPVRFASGPRALGRLATAAPVHLLERSQERPRRSVEGQRSPWIPMVVPGAMRVARTLRFTRPTSSVAFQSLHPAAPAPVLEGHSEGQRSAAIPSVLTTTSICAVLAAEFATELRSQARGLLAAEEPGEMARIVSERNEIPQPAVLRGTTQRARQVVRTGCAEAVSPEGFAPSVPAPPEPPAALETSRVAVFRHALRCPQLDLRWTARACASEPAWGRANLAVPAVAPEGEAVRPALRPFCCGTTVDPIRRLLRRPQAQALPVPSQVDGTTHPGPAHKTFWIRSTRFDLVIPGPQMGDLRTQLGQEVDTDLIRIFGPTQVILERYEVASPIRPVEIGSLTSRALGRVLTTSTACWNSRAALASPRFSFHATAVAPTVARSMAGPDLVQNLLVPARPAAPLWSAGGL